MNYHGAFCAQRAQFENRHHMTEESFDVLLEILRDKITVNYVKSMASTDRNEPIYPEVVLASGLRFLGGDFPKTIADLFGFSVNSAVRVIQLFMDAVECCPQLELKLPTTDEEIEKCRDEWAQLSSAGGLFYGFVGAIDGWLCCSKMPKGVDNQLDYRSGHYQRYGLNIQAVCDANLRFLYFTVVAPGKCNDARAFKRCEKLNKWLDNLPDGVFVGGDNAYPLSRTMMIPYSGADRSDPDKRTFNYFLSQLRIRVEMSFGLLTTKWRIFRRDLEYGLSKNVQICNVAARLHNFVIDQEKVKIDYLGIYFTKEEARNAANIVPLDDGPSNNMGFLENLPTREPGNEDGSLRSSILGTIISGELGRPDHNIERNEDEVMSEYEEDEDVGHLLLEDDEGIRDGTAEHKE
jgi:hypothetical protein